MGTISLNVHDLVRIDPAKAASALPGGAPDWVAAALGWAPWAVVRREHERERGVIPIGIRGRARAQRYATRVAIDDVVARVEPYDICLAAARTGDRLGEASRSIATFARERELVWGPVGSYGFQITSGCIATTPQSDLDIVVRAATASRETLLALHGLCAGIATTHAVTVDVELTFDFGGIALAEYASEPLRVLAKTAHGPKLVTCP